MIQARNRWEKGKVAGMEWNRTAYVNLKNIKGQLDEGIPGIGGGFGYDFNIFDRIGSEKCGGDVRKRYL